MESKPVVKSKTITFNLTSTLLINAVWPFLPADFRSQEYAVPTLTAWFLIGNTILRMVTHKRLSLFGESNETEQDPAP